MALGTSENVGPDGQAVQARTWTGATWTVASNEAINTPTEGAELVINGTMEVDANWHDQGTPVTNERSNIQAHGGTFSRHVLQNNGFEGIKSDVLTIVTGTWYRLIAWAYDITSFTIIYQLRNGNDSAWETFGKNYNSPGAAWLERVQVTRCSLGGAAAFVAFYNSNAVGEWYVDDVSLVPLTLSTLFSSLETSTADVVAQVELDTVVDSAPAGMVLNLDDAATPANFVIAYHDGASAKLDKCVAGTDTSVISAAATYAAGATLVVVKDGTSYSLFYNSAKVGSTSTIADAGIIDNTLHGMFSTYSGNQLDQFLVMPRGSNGEFGDLDRWSGVNP